MEETRNKKLLLENGQEVLIETSTRQEPEGEKSTFISINTGYVRIRVVQRISLRDLMSHNAKIGMSVTDETDDLTAIETIALSLVEAIKIAKQLNERVRL